MLDATSNSHYIILMYAEQWALSSEVARGQMVRT